MALSNHFKFKKGLLALAVSGALAGCGSDSDSSSSTTVTPTTASSTAFTVSLADAPDSVASAAFDWTNPLSLLMPKAYAAKTGLDLSNFSVVVVDADGNVVETVDAEDLVIEELGNGRYEITVPGSEQLNCLIAVNLDGPLVIQVGDDITETNSLFAPTTAKEIDLDLESTVAYQQFLKTVDDFDDYDVDDPAQVAAIEELINNVEQQLEALDLETLLDDANTSLADLLGDDEALQLQIEQTVGNIIEEQIDQIADATATSIADLVNSGGLNWFEADVDVEFSQNNAPYSFDFDDLEVERGTISATGTELFYEYDFDEDEWGEAETFDPTSDTATEDLILTANGWANSADAFSVVDIDTESGSITIQDAAVASVQMNIGTLQALDLEGKSVESFMDTNADQEDLAVFMASDAMFSANASAVKISFTNVNELYSLRYDDGDENSCWGENSTPADFGGNCERVYLDGEETAPTSLNSLVTNIASLPGEQGFVGIWIDGGILVQLLETETINADTQDVTTVRTARFFTENTSDEPGAPDRVLFVPEDESDTVWSLASPTGLAEGESIIVLPIPEGIHQASDLDESETTLIYAVVDGFVRPGAYQMAGQQEDESAWVFNTVAAGDVLNAFNPLYQDAFLVNCDYESGWNDDAFDGLGAPLEANTLKAFTASVNAAGCGGIDSAVTEAVLTANTWYEDGDAYTFNADGSGSVSFLDENDQGVEEEVSLALTWSVNTTADDNIPNGTVVAVIETELEGVAFTFTEHYAPVGYDAENNRLSLKIFSTNSLWYGNDSDFPDGSGEIWTSTFSSTADDNVTEAPELL
ncbi:hypothetical protein [Litoribacillus peritrichatus]|uniref:Uncharacterized protein n=1 Tax=Litoribacillus peritrichatus TaxID=718191 RepID=A0ABP7MKY8_9GAMM